MRQPRIESAIESRRGVSLVPDLPKREPVDEKIMPCLQSFGARSDLKFGFHFCRSLRSGQEWSWRWRVRLRGLAAECKMNARSLVHAKGPSREIREGPFSKTLGDRPPS